MKLKFNTKKASSLKFFLSKWLIYFVKKSFQQFLIGWKKNYQQQACIFTCIDYDGAMS